MRFADFLKEEENKQYKLFVDLDGVVADFEAGIEKALKTVYGEDEEYSEKRYEQDPKYRSRMWKATWKYQNEHGGELWYDLPLLPDAQKLWDYVKKYNPEILTASGNPQYGADEQKHRWVREHFGPNVKVNVVQKANDKQQYADQNHILIDDKEKAINPWKQAGGIGILHTSADITISQLKKLGL